jgi:hypothetical protein
MVGNQTKPIVGLKRPRPWDAVTFQLPASIPTMITREECRYLYWLANSFWTDTGHVLEMGPWLGGSTFCLAAGMAAAKPERRHRLHVFDSFEWREFMASRAPLNLTVGASFQPIFEKNLEPFGDFTVAHRMLLPDELLEQTDASVAEYRSRAVSLVDEEFTWTDGPVEIAFIDGAKSWTGMLHLLAETASSFMPKRTLLVCQDYKHWACYWVTAVMELLSLHMRPVHVLTFNTVTFRLEQPISRQHIDSLPRLDDLPINRGVELIENAAKRLALLGDASGAALVRLGKTAFLIHRGRPEEACEEFRAIERSWSPRFQGKNLAEARTWLEARTGKALPPSSLHQARSSAYAALSLGRRTLYRLGSKVLRAAHSRET